MEIVDVMLVLQVIMSMGTTMNMVNARLLKFLQDFLALSSMDMKESVGHVVLMVDGQSASVAQLMKFFRILMKQLRSSLADEVPNNMKLCRPKHPYNIL